MRTTTRSDDQRLKTMMHETGQQFFYVVKGINVVIIQADRIPELEGRSLDMVDGRLELR